MSWVCTEFAGGVLREALRTLEYDPDDVPHNLLSRIGEVRAFAAVHREFERIMAPGGSSVGDTGPALQRLKQHGMWESYEAAVSDRAHGRG